MTATATQTATYTDIDVKNVVRRLKADLLMIAEASGAITSLKAREYGEDIELLAIKGYLKAVDLTLLNNYGLEEKAARYTVDTDAGGLTSSRPGGVLWPTVNNGKLRVVLMHTFAYTSERQESLASQLNCNWTPSTADTSHSGLESSGGRDYSSSTYGMKREDWA